MIDPRNRGVSSRRSRSGVLIPVGALIAFAALWTGFWFYSAHRAGEIMSGWLEREERLGRIYRCGSRDIGGFPFRFEVRCRDIAADLRNGDRLLSATLPDAIVVAQIWDPTFLIGEFTGPFLISDGADRSKTVAHWRLARSSVRGTPRNPQRISVSADDLTVDRANADGTTDRLISGQHAEFHSRLAEGSLQERPVLDFAAHLVAVAAPGLHPLARDAFDADIDTTLRGLKDVAAKPWAARFKEIQQSNGRIEVKSARVSQGEWLAIANGNLGLTERGGLNGELRVTIAGLDKMLDRFGIQYLAQPGGGGAKINSAIDALDKLAPGLGGLVRQKAGTVISAGLTSLGEKTDLEGRQAVILPLRFEDGRASLGPIALGDTHPLF